MNKTNHWLVLMLCVIMLCMQGCSGVQKDTVREGAASQAAAGSKTEIDEVVREAYYYAGLSDEEKKVYEQVYRALTQRQEVSVSTLSQEMLDKVFACVLNDHPEIFYVSRYICTSRTRDGEEVLLTFAGDYDYDEDECADREAMLEKEAERILSGIPADASDFDKIKYIFDLLVNETEYEKDADDNQNICSALLWHSSNCKGYAKATQYLLEKAGIQTTLVRGTADGENHVWNLVMADGAWYYLDTTWGDVDYQSRREGEQVDPEVMEISYDYFMITSDRLYETHIPDKLVPLPDCIATEDNYYVHEGLYLTGLDTEILHRIFENAYEKNAVTVQFQCANDAVFEQVSVYLLDEQHIFDFVDALDTVPYVDNPEMNTFCFWL
ncbi:MAG: transglutaminase domain-containing protein [Lachnospiraceae bacterium]